MGLTWVRVIIHPPSNPSKLHFYKLIVVTRVKYIPLAYMIKLLRKLVAQYGIK